MSGVAETPRAAAPPPPPSLPTRGLPTAPSASRVWSRALVLLGVVLGVWALDQICNILMDLWLLQSLGYEDVFWTNFHMELGLFAIALVLLMVAIALPAFVNGLSKAAKRRAIGIGLMVGILLGVGLASRYRNYLLFFNGHSFGQDDPAFGHDIGFYVFDLPAIKTTIHAVEDLALIGILASIVGSVLAKREDLRPAGFGRMRRVIGRASSPLTLVWVGVLGLTLAIDIWFQRYDLLTKDNTEASIPNGAQAIDVSGFFSSNNLMWIEAFAELLLAASVIGILWSLREGVTKPGASRWQRRTTRRAIALAVLPGLAVTVLFTIGVAIRSRIEIKPNEPVVQLPYIKRHIDATNTAYGMNDVEVKQFIPNGREDPPPDLNDLLNSPTIKNAPLWPGYHATLERQVDPEYLNRILLKEGDPTIYGPTMEAYQQQQKLRPYYDFMDVDTVRYTVNGPDGPEPRLFASAVRELPLVEPQPWLAWWGQRYMLFTHGSGLVMNLLAGITPDGYAQYASRDIPTKTDDPALDVENPAVYYGEGAGSMAYSDVADISEHDFPTAEGRAQIKYPKDVRAGVVLDNPLKRAVFGWKSRQFWEIFFSDLIKKDSRVHYFRTPLERIEAVAPYLWTDTDPYAVTAGNRITWMLNGMTISNRYPYSQIQELGDKSYVRTPTPRRTRWVNYVQDSVKGTVDAFTGQINLYKWKDEPVIDTWADIYPDLFKSKEEMPENLSAQVQYPVQLMHIQFDDTWIFSHMKDPLTYFSQEDLFDDGDEVKGPLIDGLEGAPLSFSIEPYYWMADAGEGPMPPAQSGDHEFAMSTIFTPESAPNLRSIVTAYMDGPDYGKISMAVVPKGEYHPGPQQADAAIDQDPFISQQIGFWTRRGLEVIRGHTTPLVVKNELLYVEPLFVRSVQNPVPQLLRVIVVYRGDAFMSQTLPGALREAVFGRAHFPIRPGPDLGGEPGFAQNGDRIISKDLDVGPNGKARTEVPDTVTGGGKTKDVGGGTSSSSGGRPENAGPRG